MNLQTTIQKWLELGFSIKLLDSNAKTDKNLWGMINAFWPDDWSQEIAKAVDYNLNISLYMGAHHTKTANFDHYVPFALDFDDPDLYRQWKAARPNLASTLTQQTPSGGYHVILALPYELNSAKSERLDIISSGWYILIEPSTLTTGPYKWLTPPFDTDIIRLANLEQTGIFNLIDRNKLNWEASDYDQPDEEWEDQD